MNNVMRRALVLVITLSVLALPAVAKADTISLGTFSFDQFIVSGGDPPLIGTSVFTVLNFTGESALGFDFPVVTPVTLTNVVLQYSYRTQSGGTGVMTYPGVGLIGPGAYSHVDSQIPDSTAVIQASLTAGLDTLTLALSDGSIFTILPGTGRITWTLWPPVNGFLEPGTLVSLFVDGTLTPAAVPEPGILLLIGSGLAAMIGTRRAHRAKR